jgi:dsDNA-specific endonuclease/ATPase MutS2
LNSSTTLEFHKILEQLCELAVCENARRRLSELQPYLSESECKRRMQETTEAKAILTLLGTPPLASMKNVGMLLELCEKGSMLTAEELMQIAQFLLSSRLLESSRVPSRLALSIGFPPFFASIRQSGAFRRSNIKSTVMIASRSFFYF